MHNDLLARASRLEAFAVRDPGNTQLLRDLAQTYHQGGDHAKALQVLERIDPSDQADEPLRGQLLLALGIWDEAAHLFEHALRREPASAALWFNRGYALWAAGADLAEAASCLAKAAQLSPEDPRIRRHLALAYDSAGELERALQTLTTALEAGCVDCELLVLLSQLELQTGHIEGAQQAAERAIAADPRFAPAWQAKGQASLFAMDAAAAYKALRQASALDPHDSDCQVLLAQACLMLGRPHQARHLIDSLNKVGAADSTALCLLGWACCAEDDVAAAQDAFESALAQDPENADALAGLACLLAARGEREAARSTVARALQIEPEHATAKLVQAQCDSSTPQAESSMAAVLAAKPFGPIDASIAQAMGMPEVKTAATRMQTRYRRLAKPNLPLRKGAPQP